ncbi:cyclophilin-like fold protein [Ruminococcus sp.]|uniref:cyclophilin-like fold protein n=1 Tax=Ruminococcus sp. TaxID=41978 RepID=UPI002872D371|nr:cyclophilin-like fold protein [Ruminococcus sp.]
MKKILTAVLLISMVCALLSACNGTQENEAATETITQTATQASTITKETTQPTNADDVSETQPLTSAPESTQVLQIIEQPEHDEEHPQNEVDQTPEQDLTLQMTIGGTPVSVTWEDNEAVQALKELCRSQTFTLNMSMYGGFEQVGSIGTTLPQNDVQTTTSAGDIVLYSGDQMVVFYGSNTWAYTRLGHITDQDEDDMTQLLANGDTIITINLG